jgi:hypothetical protein
MAQAPLTHSTSVLPYWSALLSVAGQKGAPELHMQSLAARYGVDGPLRGDREAEDLRGRESVGELP